MSVTIVWMACVLYQKAVNAIRKFSRLMGRKVVEGDAMNRLTFTSVTQLIAWS